MSHSVHESVSQSVPAFSHVHTVSMIMWLYYECVYTEYDNVHICLYRKHSIFDFKAETLAKQMTLLDAEYFYKLDVSLSLFPIISLTILCVCRYTRCWVGLKKLMKRRVQDWQSSPNTSTMCHNGTCAVNIVCIHTYIQGVFLNGTFRQLV